MTYRLKLVFRWCATIIWHADYARAPQQQEWYTVSCIVGLPPQYQAPGLLQLCALYGNDVLLYDLHQAPVPFTPADGLTLLNLDLTPFGGRIPQLFADLELITEPSAGIAMGGRGAHDYGVAQ